MGIILALAVQFFSQLVYGRFLKRLAEAGAVDELFSKTLSDIGFEKNILIKYALKKRNTLTFIVEKVVDENGEERYYIPDKNAQKAASLYRPDGFSLLTVLLTAAGLIVIFYMCKYVIPYLFD
jgi:hypothetical protein